MIAIVILLIIGVVLMFIFWDKTKKEEAKETPTAKFNPDTHKGKSLNKYQIVDDSIIIPKSEIIRLIEESYKECCEFQEMKGTEFHAAMLRSEGAGMTWQYLFSLFNK